MAILNKKTLLALVAASTMGGSVLAQADNEFTYCPSPENISVTAAQHTNQGQHYVAVSNSINADGSNSSVVSVVNSVIQFTGPLTDIEFTSFDSAVVSTWDSPMVACSYHGVATNGNGHAVEFKHRTGFHRALTNTELSAILAAGNYQESISPALHFCFAGTDCQVSVK